jgi:putative sterol carrier protein
MIRRGIMTPAEWYGDKAEKIKANPAAIEGIKGSFMWDYSLDDNGFWHMVFPGDGTCEVGSGEIPDPDIKFKAKWENMYKIIIGELNGNLATMTGRLKIKGDMKLAMKLTIITSL